MREWLASLAAELPAVISRRAGFERRAEQLAGAIAASLAERPVLCDLMSAQAAVLEHNVSVEAITRHKLAGVADAETICGLVSDALPELDDAAVWKYVVAIWLVTASLWPYSRPPEALIAAHAADERLGRMELDFRSELADHLTTVAIGLRARAARP
jgi:hypothetical protein